jgi:hypothetical protein
MVPRIPTIMYRTEPAIDTRERSSQKALYLLCFALNRIYENGELKPRVYSKCLENYPRVHYIVDFAVRFFALVGALVTFPYTIYGLREWAHSESYRLASQKKEPTCPIHESFTHLTQEALQSKNNTSLLEKLKVLNDNPDHRKIAVRAILEASGDDFFALHFNQKIVFFIWYNCIDDNQREQILKSIGKHARPFLFVDLYIAAFKENKPVAVRILNELGKDKCNDIFYSEAVWVSYSPQLLLTLDTLGLRNKIQSNWEKHNLLNWQFCAPLSLEEQRQLKELIPLDRLSGKALAGTLQAIGDVKIPLLPILLSLFTTQIGSIEVSDIVSLSIFEKDLVFRKAIITYIPPENLFFSICWSYHSKKLIDPLYLSIAAELFLSIDTDTKRCTFINNLHKFNTNFEGTFYALIEQNKNNNAFLESIFHAVSEDKLVQCTLKLPSSVLPIYVNILRERNLLQQVIDKETNVYLLFYLLDTLEQEPFVQKGGMVPEFFISLTQRALASKSNASLLEKLNKYPTHQMIALTVILKAMDKAVEIQENETDATQKTRNQNIDLIQGWFVAIFAGRFQDENASEAFIKQATNNDGFDIASALLALHFGVLDILIIGSLINNKPDSAALVAQKMASKDRDFLFQGYALDESNPLSPKLKKLQDQGFGHDEKPGLKMRRKKKEEVQKLLNSTMHQDAMHRFV